MRWLLVLGTLVALSSAASAASIRYKPNGGSWQDDPAGATYSNATVNTFAEGDQEYWRITTGSGTLDIPKDHPSLSQAETNALTIAQNQGDSNNTVTTSKPGSTTNVDSVATGP